MLSSGSRDRLILQRDVRTPNPVERRLIGHRQEVNTSLLQVSLTYLEFIFNQIDTGVCNMQFSF